MTGLMSNSEDDDLNVAEPFRWLSPREIIDGDDGPELDGDREPRPRSPRTPSSSRAVGSQRRLSPYLPM